MKHVKSLIIAIVVVLVAIGTVALLVVLEGKDDTFRSRTMFAMDTTLDITIQGREKKHSQEDVDAAYALVKKIESHSSMFKKGSDVSLINKSAGVKSIKVHPDTLSMIETSLKYSELTGGAFDVTVAPIVRLWGFYSGRYRVPSPEEIAKTLPLVDYRKVLIDHERSTGMLAQPAMEMDLGGVAKGYAVRAMYDLLKARGVRSGLINFGGAVGAIGRRSDGKPWVVGIKSPRDEAGDLAGEVNLEDSFVSSSGDYERFFIKDGKRYCHIFDPKTGYQPVSVIADTVIGPDSAADDILSTALFVMGPDRGLAFLEGSGGYAGLFIDSSGTVRQSGGLRKYVITMKDHI